MNEEIDIVFGVAILVLRTLEPLLFLCSVGVHEATLSCTLSNSPTKLRATTEYHSSGLHTRNAGF